MARKDDGMDWNFVLTIAIGIGLGMLVGMVLQGFWQKAMTWIPSPAAAQVASTANTQIAAPPGK